MRAVIRDEARNATGFPWSTEGVVLPSILRHEPDQDDGCLVTIQSRFVKLPIRTGINLPQMGIEA